MRNFDMGVVGWALTAVAVSSALVRLILGALAVHATRKLLTESTDRTHLLAVLRALLSSLKSPRR
ncbi:hypothetical protein [Streptomyces meridianus]|uniref:Uncharacterized protein n=1 Tax=Streptomyces meridianus TaxID=2938945 RepID=A0ABT0X942_9ACTN|nr:hypothetical protein [Streptomyces meridianus]MCM2579051.1 hypothetical protein [Streptomyces meridianus]